MFPHLLNFLARAFFAMPSRVAGNWTEVFFGLGIFVLAELLTIKVRGWETVKSRWIESLGIGTAAVVIGWIGLFLYSATLEVYEDHQSLARRNEELVRKNRELADANSRLVDPNELKKQLAERKPLPAAIPSKSEPAVRVTEQKEIIPSPRPEEKHALQVTVEATKTIQPVHLRLQCNGPLHAVFLREPEFLVKYSYGVVPSEPDVAEVTFDFPPMDKDRPAVVLLFSNEPVKVINVRNVQ